MEKLKKLSIIGILLCTAFSLTGCFSVSFKDTTGESENDKTKPSYMYEQVFLPLAQKYLESGFDYEWCTYDANIIPNDEDYSIYRDNDKYSTSDKKYSNVKIDSHYNSGLVSISFTNNKCDSLRFEIDKNKYGYIDISDYFGIQSFSATGENSQLQSIEEVTEIIKEWDNK